MLYCTVEVTISSDSMKRWWKRETNHTVNIILADIEAKWVAPSVVSADQENDGKFLC